MRRVIIDTDPGIDDMAAILLALASPELTVEALTTVYGNGPVEACAANAWRILQAAGRRDVPVFQGAGKPLLRPATPGWASPVHGRDALGDTGQPLPSPDTAPGGSQHAVWEIIRRVMASPGEITLVALGRMTNLALALTLEPRLAQRVAEVVVMGGAVSVPGNVSPVATANLYEDPEAAAILYRSGVPLVQVGLDVCDQVEVSGRQLGRLAEANTPATRLLLAATPCIQRYYRSRGLLTDNDGAHYNDLSAIAYVLDPGLFRTESWHVAIETASELTRGQTVADRRHLGGQLPNARVCVAVDAARLTELFTERVAAYRSG